MTTRQQLTLAQLAAVFGVSSVSIYLWRQGTPTKTALEAPYSPASLRRWAKANGVPIKREPEAVLASSKFAGRVLSRAKPAVKRSASGRLSGIKPGRARAAAGARA